MFEFNNIFFCNLWNYMVFSLGESRPVFTPSSPTLVLASNVYTCLTYGMSPQLLFSQSHTKTTYINSWHTRTFSPYMVFEYHHNIQNWLVFMAIPSLHSSRYFFFFLVFGGHRFWCITQETSIKSSLKYKGYL